MDRPNAVMATSSFDRTTGTFQTPIYQPYNNFRIQNQGGNIVQGQMNKISVTEVMFPYCTPTIFVGKNDFIHLWYHDVSANGQIEEVTAIYSFQIPYNFYTGLELVNELNALNSTPTAEEPVPVPMSDYLIWDWDPVTGKIYAVCAILWGVTGGIALEVQLGGAGTLGSQTYSADQLSNPFNFPNFWFTAGFRNFFATNPTIEYPQYLGAGPPTILPLEPGFISAGTPAAYVPSNYYFNVFGSYYTGRYTDYVDITSSSLCQAQYLRDSTTSQNTNRRDIIARIYICNNIATLAANPEGCRPFIIHRLFPAPKVMKWTADRSIDAIDLALFDMFGQPLPSAQSNILFDDNGDKIANAGEADYAITFHVHEPRAEAQETNIGYAYRDF